MTLKTMNAFSKFSFAGKVVKVQKANQSAYPELSIDPTYNKFTLNTKARMLLNVKEGDSVAIINVGIDANKFGGFQYFITKGYEFNGVNKGAKLGAKGSFTMVGHWGGILLNKPEIVIPSIKDLLSAEIIQPKGIETSGYYGRKKGVMHLDIENVIENAPLETDDNGDVLVAGDVYPLVGLTISDYQSFKVKEDGTTVEETENDDIEEEENDNIDNA